MSQLALHLLGPPRVELDGEPVQLARRKMVALLVYLAVTGRSHSRDFLATLLWPEYDQSSALAYLRRILSMLNKALGEGWLAVDRETAGLHPHADPSTPAAGQALWLDVDVFRQRLAACETHDHPPAETCADCLPLLGEAVALYCADFLAGFTLRDSPAFDEFQFFQTEGLRDELASALERLVGYYSARGTYEQAIPYARRRLGLDPLHEPAHRRLMGLYAQAGHRSAALRQYRTCLRVLEEELNLAPSAETTALYERIRAERARPAAAEPAAPVPPPTPTSLPAFLTEEVPAAVERPVFVVRERELARLDGYLDAALAGQGQVVFVTGGPGRGKTALMREFARRAMDAHPDLLVAGGTCNAYSGVGDPYLPFREVLGMLTGDVEARWAAGTISRDQAQRLWASLPLTLQALVDHGPFLIGAVVPNTALLSRATAVAPPGTGWLQELRALSRRKRSEYGDLEQSALFEQLTNVLRALSVHSPLLLTLDDGQWADAGSIGLLFHLGRRLQGSRILVACAYRPEEVALGRDGDRHPLEDVLSEFKRRFGDVWIDLARSDEAEARRFVDAFLDTEPNRLGEAFREGLFQRAGGHPLFTVELLRAMQEREDVVQDTDGHWVETPTLDWERLPARVEAVVEARVGRLEEELRDILAVASVEGERFTVQVVAQVQSISEREALRALSQELQARHRLVREGEEVQVAGRFLSRYQFAHALFQAHLRNSLSNGERRLLHGEIGAALEALYGDRATEIAAQLAHHYLEAGHTAKAVEYALCAGEQARLAYANEEAIAHYQRALEQLGPTPASCGELRKGFPVENESREGAWRLEALRGLGQIYHRVGRFAEAEQRLREAISLGRRIGLSPRELVRMYHWLGETTYWQFRYDDLLRIGEEGLALLGDDTESIEAALINQSIAVSDRMTGDGTSFREFSYRTAQFIQRLPYTEELGLAYYHVHWACRDDKDLEGAMSWLQALEQRATQHHDLRALASVHRGGGLLLADAGDLQGAISRAQQDLKLRIRVGDAKHEGRCLQGIGEVFLSLGDLQSAEDYARRGLETAAAVEDKRCIARSCWLCGWIALCQGDWKEAVDAFRRASQVQTGWSRGVAWTSCFSGRARFAQGDRVEALRQFQEALALAGPEDWRDRFSFRPYPPTPNRLIASALSGIEAAYDDPGAFRAFCRRFREEHPQAGDSPLVQWFLEPLGAVRPVLVVQDQCEPHLHESPLHLDEFDGTLPPGWDWQDPFGDGSFAVHNGLEVHAANGRDLWNINLSAPRMLRPASGDLVAQTICVPVSNERPASGGLLLWKDRANYLRLDRGTAGEHDVFFGGCLENQEVIIGRGRLEWASRRVSGTSGGVFLRLERIGERVNAFCSADGESWFTVGHVAFPVEDPIQVGLHAIGNIDRTVYHGAYPDGTAIRFESFRLWEM